PLPQHQGRPSHRDIGSTLAAAANPRQLYLPPDRAGGRGRPVPGEHRRALRRGGGNDGLVHLHGHRRLAAPRRRRDGTTERGADLVGTLQVIRRTQTTQPRPAPGPAAGLSTDRTFARSRSSGSAPRPSTSVALRPSSGSAERSAPGYSERPRAGAGKGS